MELFSYYSIDECKNRTRVFEFLNTLKNDGKIEYTKHGIDVLKIEDIDLEESDIEEMTDMFDDEDVFPYLEKEEDGEDDVDIDDDYDGYYSEGY